MSSRVYERPTVNAPAPSARRTPMASLTFGRQPSTPPGSGTGSPTAAASTSQALESADNYPIGSFVLQSIFVYGRPLASIDVPLGP